MNLPSATYRLQFCPDFGFTAARDVVDYLAELGVTAVYASPIFQPRAGSQHGYDVVDPNRLNPELGTGEDFEALIEHVRKRNLGWVQDIVPNHMAYDGQNRMLMDVLENGEASPYFDFFDIDWNHPYDGMKGKVLAPFLGGFYGECLENGEIVLGYDQNGLSILYHGLKLPLNIESYADVLAQDLAGLRRRLGASHADLIKLLGVLYTLKNFPPLEQSAERADQPAHSPDIFGRQAEYHYSAQPSASSKATEAFGRDASASQEVQAKASIEARSREGVERAARALERE